MIASQNGHSQVAELLLKQQADPNIQNNNGWTALMDASQNGHPEVADKQILTF
jgi:serine/threonine-protein phosphatase 6 regulatory ankyrin repeat subunit B